MIDVLGQFSISTKPTVARWHQREIDNPYEGFLRLVCLQHEQNYRLWHQEDIARSPDVTDAEIAKVKRTIDKLNQNRNDMIERLDDCLLDELVGRGRPNRARGPAEHGNARQRDRPPFDHRPAALSHGGAGRAAPRPRRATSPRPRSAGNPPRAAPQSGRRRWASCWPTSSPAASG